MRLNSVVSILVGGFLFGAVSWAHAEYNSSACPSDAKDSMDAEFSLTADGTQTTSDITRCLAKREGVKVVVNVSSNAVNGKNKIAQQINNVKNMVENYEGIYGMKYGYDGYRIAVVIHGSAGKFGLDSAVYDAKFNSVGENQPTVNAINFLLSKGVHVYMCQNTMRSNGYKTADLIPGMEEVPAGVTAVTDFGSLGWVVLTP